MLLFAYFGTVPDFFAALLLKNIALSFEVLLQLVYFSTAAICLDYLLWLEG